MFRRFRCVQTFFTKATLLHVVRVSTVQATSNRYAEYERQQSSEEVFLTDFCVVRVHYAIDPFLSHIIVKYLNCLLDQAATTVNIFLVYSSRVLAHGLV